MIPTHMVDNVILKYDVSKKVAEKYKAGMAKSAEVVVDFVKEGITFVTEVGVAFKEA